MSRQNVEIVRELLEAWASGDFRSGSDNLDQHLVFIVPPDFPESGVFHGPEGVGEFMSRFLEQFERVTIEAKHVEAVGDTVLAHVVQHQKGRASGIEGDNSYFMLSPSVARRSCGWKP
jgi:ketosteroid isomerase-like protein